MSEPSHPRDGDFELVTLRNGHRAVRHLGHGEVMHPAVGPWQEALRLYVDQPGLADRLKQPGPPLVIHDVGLGAATNAVAALTRARDLGPDRARDLHVVSFEVDLAPLRLALADAEGFPFLQPFRAACESLMAHGTWSEPGIHWELKLGDAVPFLEPDAALPPADLVFFDPFSPASNPDMWTEGVLARVRRHCREDGEGALLMTYSAATPTRVTLLLAGFYVGAGVSTGTKGETTVASTRFESLAAPLGTRWLERWERSSSRAPHGGTLTPEVERRLRTHPQWR
ncbi:tRNA (5-methylaminomethyl-2-thiouridine)(34)-methyltransferase MnmD [Corallococcus interemptor]|uniref:tRNA (5-methylaminomethyl-2-thiouridine)(34)-methyltransferase MnmD n=1 Tax=Corallococcus interemptor TaxID=2316720 RepID=UPI003CFE8375